MFLPVNRDEMKELGWEWLDVILITGDAYVDHYTFGAALIGKLLVENGYKVGIIPQPKWSDNSDFEKLPSPRLFVGITSGNVDSMVSNYTSNKRKRRDDDFSEGGASGKRPDRSVIIYTNKARENFKNVPIILGGIEGSLRRIAHYDYWSNKIRKAILFDSKADLLVFGLGEKAILDIAKKLKSGKPVTTIRTVRNTSYILSKNENINKKYNYIPLPSYEESVESKDKFAEMNRLLHTHRNPFLETGFTQITNNRILVINPQQLPLTTAESDKIYDMDFERKPHPMYKLSIPAFDMIKNSVNIHRGCYGGCSFCAIALHQGSFIQSRSEESILKELELLEAKTITDLGGPSANMYKSHGIDFEKCKKCQRQSCLYPKICPNLDVSHKDIIALYKKAATMKKVFINSGIRHDLALESPEYIKLIAEKHTSGILKIAPEHTQNKVLKFMLKPDVGKYEEFVRLFKKYSPKEQYIVPYLIASFPGCDLEEMTKMMNYLKKNNIRIKQIQDFIPTPLTIATAFYVTGKNIFNNGKMHIPLDDKERRIHRAMMQYFTPENRKILKKYFKD